MYSYGSSARASIGKSGHGGRDYRPPRNRRDPNATPPPLKQCSCLCQLDFSEYSTTAAVRNHASFGGREGLDILERQLRAEFLVHLVVPGKKQAGPVAIIGQTYREALPAVAFLLQHVSRIREWTSSTIRGRIQRRVQDANDVLLDGLWRVPHPVLNVDNDVGVVPPVQIVWLFQCPSHWNVMVCFLPIANDRSSSLEYAGNGNHETAQYSMDELLAMETLQITFDNLKFEMGNMDGVEIFLHDNPFMAFGAGTLSRTKTLYEEVQRALVNSQEL